MDYKKLIEKIEDYIKTTFRTHNTLNLSYHTLVHTSNVVKASIKIANHYQLDDNDFFVVVAASWFHDIGYYFGSANGHELKSAELAEQFLTNKGVSAEMILAVKACILATKMPQKPEGILEKIICDADLYHLGTDDFLEMNKLMRKEAEILKGEKTSKDDWRKHTVSFLEQHHYHTEYCRELLEGKKHQNLEQLKHKGNAVEVNPPIIIDQPTSKTTMSPISEIPTEKKQKTDNRERSIETMFRITSNNNQRLSDMADNKAQIMITTTSIIISVLLSVLLRKLEDNPYLTIPTILLLAVCVITMVFSILATRPSVPKGEFTQQEFDAQNVNLLFFGNFYRMSFEDYALGLQKIMNDREFLYKSLTMDVYYQGVVLGKKFKLLRIAYNVFMFGIVASVLAFTIATIFMGN